MRLSELFEDTTGDVFEYEGRLWCYSAKYHMIYDLYLDLMFDQFTDALWEMGENDGYNMGAWRRYERGLVPRTLISIKQLKKG